MPARGRRSIPLKIISTALTAAAILVGMPKVAEALDPKWLPSATCHRGKDLLLA
jgi:hypothetical protein